jgi:uncharacterized SAM-binding protein YcdF (DUF218 family)
MFIFKKIVSRFFFPMQLILLISFTGLFLLWFSKKKKTGKIFITIGLFLFLASGTPFVSDSFLGFLESRYRPCDIQLSSESHIAQTRYPIKFVLVLGSGCVSENPELPITSRIDGASIVRLIEGIRIYRKNPESKLILSGGSPCNSVPNAWIMGNIARQLGVDGNDIIIESKSKDTRHEAELIKPIVDKNGFILVTSASHMPRSIAMFKKLGMNPVPAPTEHLIKGLKSDFFPGAYNLYKMKKAFYEFMGIIWAKLRGQV